MKEHLMMTKMMMIRKKCWIPKNEISRDYRPVEEQSQNSIKDANNFIFDNEFEEEGIYAGEENTEDVDAD